MRKLITRKRVSELTGLPASSVYYFVNQGVLPKPIRLTERCSRWIESEIEEFIDGREKEREASA